MDSLSREDPSQKAIEGDLVDTGEKLLTLSSSTDELLILLEKAESLLAKVRQRPPKSTCYAVIPAMKALITDKILCHGDVNVQVAVASCFNELTRLTSPQHPYNDDIMKVLFQLLMTAFKQLSCESGQNYSRALYIIEIMAKVKSYLMLLNIGADGLIVDMFQIFLNNTKSTHPSDVFGYMKIIMTSLIEESDEISFELLKPLLDSVKMDNKNTSPISWELGKKVFENCATKLQSFLRKAVKEMNMHVADYAEIVASICHDTFNEENMVPEEVTPTVGGGASQLDGLSKVVHKYPYNQANDGSATKLIGENSSETLKQSRSIMQSGTNTVALRSRRARKPSSLMRPEDGYQYVWTLKGKYSGEASSDGHNKEKNNSAFVSELGNAKKKKSIVNQHSKKTGKRAIAELSDIRLKKEQGTLSDTSSDSGSEMLPEEQLAREEIISWEYGDVAHKMEEFRMPKPAKAKHLRKHKGNVSREVTPTIGGSAFQLDGVSKAVQEYSDSQTNDGNGTKLNSENSLETLKGSQLVVQSETNTLSHRSRRCRKPNSVLRPEEGYQYVWTLKCKYSREASPDGHCKEKDNSAFVSELGNAKKKKSMVNLHNHLEIPSLLEKKTGKRPIAESGDIRLEKEKRFLSDTSSDGESELSPQEQHERKEIISRKHLYNKDVADKMEEFCMPMPEKAKHPMKDKENRSKRSRVDYGEELIESRIQVWWPLDEMFYAGTVKDFDPDIKKHTVLYDDDDIEILDLRKETWELLASEQPPEKQEVDHPSLTQQSVKTKETTGKRRAVSSKKEHVSSSFKRTQEKTTKRSAISSKKEHASSSSER